MIGMGNLSRLSLVVLTYERQNFALRLMNYWAGKGPHLIVLDGSNKPIELSKLHNFGSQILYLHRPIGIYQRLSEALDLVKTEFVALAGDDEFYIPTAVEACIEELDEDDGLVACCGRALGFSFYNQRVFGSPQYPQLEGYAIDAHSAEERVVQHISDYVPALSYSICSASEWKIALKYVLEKEFPFFASGELQFEMYMAYAGRSRVIPELMWLRSHGETKPIREIHPSLDDSKRFSAWWADASEKRERAEFISIMSRGFRELLPSEGADLRPAVVAGVDAYLEFSRKHNNSPDSIAMIKQLALKLIPKFAKPTLRTVLRGLRQYKSSQHTELLQAARILEDSGVRVDFLALEEIQKNIIQFHKHRNPIGF